MGRRRAGASLASQVLDARRGRPVQGNNRWALSHRVEEPHTDQWARQAAATEPRRSQGPVAVFDPWAARFAATVGVRMGEQVGIPERPGPERFLPPAQRDLLAAGDVATVDGEIYEWADGAVHAEPDRDEG